MLMTKNAILSSMYKYALTGITLLALWAPVAVSAATLTLDTGTTTYGLGDTFVATVRIDTQGECINAAQIQLAYPTDVLRAVDFSTGCSIISLWVGDPVIDTEKGGVNFSGGIPGGYCGRVQGDPSETNTLAKVIFTVIGTKSDTATLSFGPTTRVYKHDGQGTPATLTTPPSQIAIVPHATLSTNPWLTEVGADTTPPDPFTVQIESSRSVYGGKYYIVFSTVDKQSGIDHYEIFENGGWQKITSPHPLQDQLLTTALQVRAVDKAGNVRVGDFNPESAPERQYTYADFQALAVLIALTLFALGCRAYMRRGTGRAAPLGQ